MATLADSLVSTSSRRLSMRRRPDLSAKRQRYQGQSYWVVKEPVGLNYFRFQDEEFAILEMLDGTVSLDEIKERFEAEFPPQKISVEELQQFIGTLHRSGLIIANVPGQGTQLKKRRDERRKKEILGQLGNILAIRFKGFDPDRILTWMYPYFRWLFSTTAVCLSLTIAAMALLLILVQFDTFQSKLPSFHQFFNVKNVFWLWIVLGVTKVIHEFGHGLTCKHFGGECHEIGVMILVLTPCLYCNVSDSWMLPNKWHRAAIGAAGMYVEVLMASIATFVWWFTQPGLLNYLALSTMFVCSVSTIIFNGNPLLRYDGYYILSDITEIPNLRQKSSDILSRKLGWWCLGIERPDDPFLPQRNQIFFALYTVAAAAYRWFVVLSILFFLNKVWEPYRLEIIGQAIGMMAVYGLLVAPLIKVGKFFWVPGRVEKVKRARMFATLGLLATVVAAFVFVPLPYKVFCPVETRPRDAATIYVDVTGRLMESYVKPGDAATPNMEVAKLENPNVQLEIEQLILERNNAQAELENLRRGDLGNSAARLSIPEAETRLAGKNEELAEKQADQESLTLRVPADASGVILPPQENQQRATGDRELPTWMGTPMKDRNLGCVLEEGTAFCLVGDPEKVEAILIIDQQDREFITEGQKVELKLEALPGDVIEGKIEEISDSELTYSPSRLSNKAGGELSTETDETGMERPMSTSYQARMSFDDPEGILKIGLSGTAKVYAGKRTLGQRLYRYLANTFRFDL